MTTTTTDAAALDATQVARLGAALAAARAAQSVLVAEHDATAVALTGQGDVDSLLEREIAEAAAARARAAIGDIDAALARIQAGTYGTCESCGAPIALERLVAIPHTRRCITCPAKRSTSRF